MLGSIVVESLVRDIFYSVINNCTNHKYTHLYIYSYSYSCFGKIFSQIGIDIVKHMKTQRGGAGQGGLGFIEDPKNHIKIVSLELLPASFAPQ